MAANPGLSNQTNVRNTLRIVGPILAVVGIVVFVVAIKGFVDSANSDTTDLGTGSGSGFPGAAFAMFFGGFILFAVGMGMTRAGFMGAGARYAVGEFAPVAKDGLEYMTGGRGLGNLGRSDDAAPDAAAATGPFCRKCGTRNDDSAAFCDHCGASLA
ncbi:MAG: zinc ribbon domain-containing protein [Nocardioidaceae bacterium]|nr:zinc ribbon domain-containing protein [Nocardioidaceae bacterium]